MKTIPFQRAIITGASSGIGEEFAIQLAPRLQEVILVARRTERLDEVAEKLRKANPGLNIITRACDLEKRDEVCGLGEFLLSLPPSSTLLINNAGLGDYGEFRSAEASRIESMLFVNIEALTMLTHALLPTLARDGGGIVNVSSLASSLPIPDFAVYAASKSYVLSFSEALRLELKGYGIPVLAVCPGPVHTEFGQIARRSGFSGNMMPGKDFASVSREQVVSESISALEKNRARIYPGFKIKFFAGILSLLPMPLIRGIMGKRPRRCVEESE